MRTQTQLALLQQLRQRQNLVRHGFTLVELMIVVAIIGLLSAVALPQFLNARDRADAKAKVGEVVGLAKECAVFNAEANSTTTGIIPPGLTVAVGCGGPGGTPQTFSSRAWTTVVPGVQCLGHTLTGTVAAIAIEASGRMSCSG